MSESSSGASVPSVPISSSSSGASLSHLDPSQQEVVVTTWQVNTENSSRSVGRHGLHALNPPGRIGLLGDVLKGAVEHMRKMARTRDPLFIFVAPEFYFADAGAHFYDEATKESIRGGLIALSRTFPEVLIVPGSIAWYKTAAYSPARAERRKAAGKPATPRDLTKYLGRNRPESRPLTASAREMLEGLDKHREEQRGAFEARIRDGDPTVKIAQNTVFLLYNGGILHKYNKRHESIADEAFELPSKSDYRNILFPPTTTSPVVPPVKGLQIGIEICVDHEYHTLLSWSGRQNHIHIVCSASVTVGREHAAIREGGVLIQADSQSAGVYRRSDLASIREMGGSTSSLEGLEVKAKLGTLTLYAFELGVESPYFI